ncbi:hypothetical protein [Thermomonospora umbrina]|uniref:Extracellular solute-binding protein n=1 Tax=Thermomonospora umbrina TaxID=111806 RepID=A0A3D9SQY1_9ACTN|nr:hypothetical protein [Thermomonospora umbrina]REE95024.1 hypothetical protein DFJ69_0395 [Thermomonospora umbrina]
MTTDLPHVVEEPSFGIDRPPRFWGPRFGWPFAASAGVALVSAVMLLVNAFTPVEQVVTVRGIMASKEDFFNDEEVQDLLLKHHIRVEVTNRGSGEVAHEVLDQKTQHYDFAFPSGQPAADLITNERRRRRQYTRTIRLFTSPIVLATYREYAETLVGNDVADRQSGGPGGTLYYTLDMAEFIELGKRGKTWNDIGIGAYRNPRGVSITNGNRVLAHTSGVCRSNSGTTYLGLVAFVDNDHEPAQTEADVDRIAREIQPLITAIGMPESGLWQAYITPEGKSQGPIVVVYEHQFFAYQQSHRHRTGRTDTERVLLYPEQEFQTDPEYISLRPGAGERLGRLLLTDPQLRRRMMELGFRVFDDTDAAGTRRLFDLLVGRGVPRPEERTDYTRAELPELNLLQRLVDAVGRCSQ